MTNKIDRCQNRSAGSDTFVLKGVDRKRGIIYGIIHKG